MIEKNNADTHPLNSIVHEIKTTPAQHIEFRPAREMENYSVDSEELILTPRGVKTPALLLNHNMQVIWQNKAALADLWHHAAILAEKQNQPSIFDILFDPGFQSKVQNWRQWVNFFVQHAIGMLSVQEVRNIVGTLKQRQRSALEEMLNEKTATAFRHHVFSGRMRQFDTNGYNVTYWVVATDFREGRYFVFDPALAEIAETGTARSADIEQKMEMIRQNAQPVQKPVHILAARLYNAEILQTEMLSDEYSRLLSRIFQKTIETIEYYGGMVGHFTGNGIWSYFIPANQMEKDPLYVIDCALELKKKMMELGREWKIRKGWLHDIELTMGIHSGEECIGTLRTSLGDNLAAYGDTLQTAAFLSAMGRSGEIWTTKYFINKLPQKNLKQIRFGIFREDNNRQVFIARCFSRIEDLGGVEKQSVDIGGDLGALAVTQVFDQQRL